MSNSGRRKDHAHSVRAAGRCVRCGKQTGRRGGQLIPGTGVVCDRCAGKITGGNRASSS